MVRPQNMDKITLRIKYGAEILDYTQMNLSVFP